LKNGSGSVGNGKSPEAPTVTMKLDLDVFNSIMAGTVSSTQAFLSQRLEIKGNMAKAIQLEGLLSKVLKSSSKI
jgi:putative sterol carrier protein